MFKHFYKFYVNAIIKKFFFSLKSIGFKRTVIKLILKIKKKKFERMLFKIKSVQEKFNLIYSTNYWNNNESRSGTGSSLRATKNIRFHLPKIIDKFNIKKLFDAPCGDFNWMQHILKNIEIDYLGSDIVEDLIVSNKKYENNKIKFSKLDIVNEKLPEADLMICRDCLFHFSYKDIFTFLKNFLSSNIKYILLTSHLNTEPKFKNKDIVTGDFRYIDLFSQPFNFEKYIYNFDDREFEIQYFKQMYLFSKLQIKNILLKT
jgi:hypothetical protein